MTKKKTEVKANKKLRTYKTTDVDYFKAMDRAAEGRLRLSSLINEVVVAYANGADLIKFLNNNQKL